MSDWNAQIIDEFRSNDGVVGGIFDGRPMLLLHTTGAKSGLPRLHPLVYQAVDGGYAIFASKAGADTHPAWFHNLVAHPDVTIEVDTESVDVRARVLAASEREPIWQAQKHLMPQFADYEANTDRVIPVVLLSPR